MSSAVVEWMIVDGAREQYANQIGGLIATRWSRRSTVATTPDGLGVA